MATGDTSCSIQTPLDPTFKTIFLSLWPCGNGSQKTHNRSLSSPWEMSGFVSWTLVYLSLRNLLKMAQSDIKQNNNLNDFRTNVHTAMANRNTECHLGLGGQFIYVYGHWQEINYYYLTLGSLGLIWNQQAGSIAAEY